MLFYALCILRNEETKADMQNLITKIIYIFDFCIKIKKKNHIKTRDRTFLILFIASLI